jgi:hypothetical protein
MAQRVASPPMTSNLLGTQRATRKGSWAWNSTPYGRGLTHTGLGGLHSVTVLFDVTGIRRLV